MADKFTPGPWRVAVPDARYPGIDSDVANTSIVVFGDAGESDQGIQGRTQEEATANAHLIAAAPDLLAALKALTGGDEYLGMMFTARLRMAIDAIAKAEGRTPTEAA